jgi:hypothetical protein
MTEFLRVRDDRTGSEYDAPVITLEAGPHPHITVIDKEPVTEQRPPKHASEKATVVDRRLTDIPADTIEYTDFGSGRGQVVPGKRSK